MNLSWKLCLLLTIIALTTCIHEALSIKCWVCNSDVEHNCGDPFDNSTLKLIDCNASNSDPFRTNALVCRMIEQKVNEEWRIIRSCAYLGESETIGNGTSCVTRTATTNVVVKYCYCNHEDGCNSGNMV